MAEEIINQEPETIGEIFGFGYKNGGQTFKIEDGYIKLTHRPFDWYKLVKLVGSKEKAGDLFASYNMFTCKLPIFFKFELIKLLESALSSRSKYGIRTRYCKQLLEDLKPMIDIELDDNIDRDHLDDVMAFKILDHQEVAIKKYFEFKHILGYRGMLLHGSPGTGKTAMSLFIMEGLKDKLDKVIIICPLATVNDVWGRSLSGERGSVYKDKQSYWIAKDGRPYNNEKFIVCHYEALEKLQAFLPRIIGDKIGVIIDESHNVNEQNSKRTTLSLDLVNKLKTDNVLLLSGTPIKSGFRELATIIKFLDSDFTPEMEKIYYTIYKNPSTTMEKILRERYSGYATVIEKSALKLDPINNVNIKIKVPDKELEPYTLTSIRKALKEYVERRLKELDALMPEYVQLYINTRDMALEKNRHVSKSDINTYKDYVEKIKTTKDLWTVKEEMEFVRKFDEREILPFLDGQDKKDFREARVVYKYPILKVTGEALANVIGRARINCHRDLIKYLDLGKIIESGSKKTIIFSNYIDVCNKALEKCTELKYKPISVFGDTTKSLYKNVEIFINNSDINPLITTYKSLSTGVNLTAADTIVCIDMPFRMYIYEQTIARAWRLGQDRQVTIYSVTIDTPIPNINSRNIDIIKFFKEEVEKLTGTKSDIDLAANEEVNIHTEDYFFPEEDFTMDDIENIEIHTEASSSSSKRKKVENLIIDYIKKIVTGDENVNLYRELFKSMNDKQFDEFMVKLKNKEINLSIIVPNGNKKIKVSLENNYKIAKQMGFDFFQRLVFGPDGNLPGYKTPNKYMVMKLPVKRAAQLLSKKISIPKDNKSIDSLTGQVANDSRSSKLSNPELQILLGMGLEKSLIELLKMRGGDQGAQRAMTGLLYRDGMVTQSDLAKYSTGVTSTKTLKSYLLGMHIKSTL